jgi:ketosteroid isomerase-like protein
MKRTFGILAIVLVLTLTAYAGQAPKQSPSVASSLENKIRQAWQDWKDKKKDAFAAILTDEVVEVEADGKGPRGKQATLADLQNINIQKFALSDFKFTPLGDTAALETYKAVVDLTTEGKQMHFTLAVAEVWVKRGTDWKLLHYQETEMK